MPFTISDAHSKCLDHQRYHDIHDASSFHSDRKLPCPPQACSIAATHLSTDAPCCIAFCRAWYSFLYLVSRVAAVYTAHLCNNMYSSHDWYLDSVKAAQANLLIARACSLAGTEGSLPSCSAAGHLIASAHSVARCAADQTDLQFALAPASQYLINISMAVPCTIAISAIQIVK